MFLIFLEIQEISWRHMGHHPEAPSYASSTGAVPSWWKSGDSRQGRTHGGKTIRWICSAFCIYTSRAVGYSLENEHVLWNSMVGRCIFYWNSPFLGGHLFVFRGCNTSPRIHWWKWCSFSKQPRCLWPSQGKTQRFWYIYIYTLQWVVFQP